jgi:hypothetical protein
VPFCSWNEALRSFLATGLLVSDSDRRWPRFLKGRDLQTFYVGFRTETALSISNTLIEQPVEPRLSPQAAKIVSDLRARQASDPRVLVSRKAAMQMLGCGQTRLLELEKTELGRVQDGASVRITTSSIYARLERLAIESHPIGGGPTKVRQPPSMRRKARKPPRKPSENELRALAASNLKRHNDAEASRKAETPITVAE